MTGVLEAVTYLYMLLLTANGTRLMCQKAVMHGTHMER